MYKYIIFVVCTLLLVSCSPDDDIKRELIEIKKLLSEINSKLPKSKESPELLRPSNFPTLKKKSLNHEAFDKIQLPENPSKKDILQYFREIARATQGQTTFSESDPQVHMLIEVGHENLKYLVSYNADRPVNMYFIAAIRELTREEDKELILNFLPRKKDLVKVVIDKNWQEDAKPILISELNELPPYLPTEWIRAVASLDDPCTHEGLKNYLIYGSNRSWTYKAIISNTTIPNLKEAIGEAWTNARKEPSEYSRNSFAPIAASYGHVDALGVIVQALDSSDRFGSGIRDARKYIFQLTEIRGTNDEIRSWYKKNKDKLVFNTELEKFIIKQQIS